MTPFVFKMKSSPRRNGPTKWQRLNGWPAGLCGLGLILVILLGCSMISLAQLVRWNYQKVPLIQINMCRVTSPLYVGDIAAKTTTKKHFLVLMERNIGKICGRGSLAE